MMQAALELLNGYLSNVRCEDSLALGGVLYSSVDEFDDVLVLTGKQKRLFVRFSQINKIFFYMLLRHKNKNLLISIPIGK
jgi:hypothetical protein